MIFQHREIKLIIAPTCGNFIRARQPFRAFPAPGSAGLRTVSIGATDNYDCAAAKTAKCEGNEFQCESESSTAAPCGGAQQLKENLIAAQQSNCFSA